MTSLATIRALGNVDLRNLRRDPMLVWLTVFPIVMALAMRWGVPALAGLLRDRYEFDLLPYYPLILSFLLLTMPMLVGAIIGFMLLDQRDDGTLTALRVTPLTMRGYLIYRTLLPIVISLAMTVVALVISGLMKGLTSLLVIYAIVAAPLAPLFGLFVATCAANKIQGFAIMKASGVLSWPALIAWFVAMPWQLAFGVVPHYWIVKVVWAGESGVAAWPFALAAILFQVLLLVFFLRRFDKILTR